MARHHDRKAEPSDELADRPAAKAALDRQSMPLGGIPGLPSQTHDPSPTDLVWLQKAAGNTAVSAMLAARTRKAGRAAVQRWVGPEHRQLGDLAKRSIDLGNGVTVSWGDIVAIAGDEYGSFQKLLDDTKTAAGRARIRAALEHGGIGDSRSAGALPEPTKDQRSEQEQKFLLLALENVEHFAAGGLALDTWRQHHAQALEQALQAGLSGRAGEMQLAEAREAFGQHFLTDIFSGGHVRTPRAAIIQWYTDTFAPRVVDTFLNNVRSMAIDAVFYEVMPQVKSSWVPPSIVRGKVENGVDQKLQEAIKAIGGQAGLVRWFGLVMAGAVSGALHDLEGERGVWVVSESHPAPFQAFGDTFLNDPRNAVNREQAGQAVVAARDDLTKAFVAGEREGAAILIDPADLPATVYFGFDSFALTADAARKAQTAATYLVHHPDMRVDLVGHTDPIGKPGYNQTLGQNRAAAVAGVLSGGGVPPSQLGPPESAGSTGLVSTEPRRYFMNRRVEFVWRSQPATLFLSTQDIASTRARFAVEAQVGPPYRGVEKYVPRPVEEAQMVSMNVPLEEWRWGSMHPTLVARLDAWIVERVKPQIGTLIASDKLDDIKVEGYDVHPRPTVKRIIDDLLAAPTAYLSRLFGQAPGK